MKLLSTLFLVLFSIQIYGQEYYFINAENGLNVRSEGNLASKKIAKIPFGTLVEKIDDSGETLSVSDNGKQITGKFVKVNYSKTYLSTNAIEGYVFDGYLKKQINDKLIGITKIDKQKYAEFLKAASKATYKPNWISTLDAVKNVLDDRVEWFNEGRVKGITLPNEMKFLFNKNAVDFGFSEGQSGYYPEEEILVLEGGHGSDVCFSIKTGETELTIGNPEYIIPSPKNTYRLNGYFGGQECISYFFQKYENGKFIYLTALNQEYDICTFKDFYWISENEFIYVVMDYLIDSENGIEEYFKGKIKISSNSITTKEEIVDSTEIDSSEKVKKTDFEKLISTLEFKKIPIIDSTNFDNFDKIIFFSGLEISTLQINEIYPDFYTEGYNYKSTSSYRIVLSEKFHSIVLTTYKGEHEMESILANYDLDGKLIDYKVISYDEIAESSSRIESKIEKNKLTIKNILWIDEKQVEIVLFEIGPYGKIRPFYSKG